MRVVTVIFLMIFSASMLNAKTFKCRDYKRNLYAKIWQSSNNRNMVLYNDRGHTVDRLHIGRAQSGTVRWYGNKTTIYIYKNRRQFSIRYYDGRRNTIGNIFGVFTCR